MLVKFIDVGRDKKCWEADIPLTVDGELDGHAMIRSIKRAKVLLSRNIELEEDGAIFAGMRLVGKWQAQPQLDN